MNHLSKIFIALSLLLSGVACAAPAFDFSRYNIILTRRPFGEAPADSAADDTGRPPPVQTGPSFADSLRVCAMTDVDGLLRVGIVDIKAKPMKTYFLFVGETSEDGIQVVDANYDDESVTLQKGDDVRQLSMSGGGASSASASRPASGSMSRSAAARRRRIHRTREQIEEERRKAIERKKPILSGKEYEDHIRQYNLEQIRSGGIPLPIALTPEEDALLVEEGVLAPVE